MYAHYIAINLRYITNDLLPVSKNILLKLLRIFKIHSKIKNIEYTIHFEGMNLCPSGQSQSCL